MTKRLLTRATIILITAFAYLIFSAGPDRIATQAQSISLGSGGISVSAGGVKVSTGPLGGSSSSSAMSPAAAAASSAGKGTPSSGKLQTVNQEGERIECAQLAEAKGVILGRIVPCVSKTIEGATIRFTIAMIALFKPIMMSFFVLVITFYGVRLLQGGGQMHVEGILLVMKMTLVIMVLNMMPGTFIPAMYDVMTETQEVVANAVNPETSSLKCDVANYRANGTPQVWAHMDCLLGKLYGFTTGSETGPNGEKKPNMLLASSIFGLLGGFFFGGTFGATLFLACVGVLWTMFMLVLRTASTFLNAYLYGAVSFIISPIFLPLILLNATRTYFEPWWKGILASILMPLVITSYSMFALLLYDKMMFSDDALINQLFNNKLVQQMQGENKPICDVQQTGNPDARSNASGIQQSVLYSNPFFKNFINPMLSAANNRCGGFSKTTLNESALADVAGNKIDGKSPKDVFTKLFYDAVKLFVLAVLINSGFTNIQNLSLRIIGSGAVASTMQPQGEAERKMMSVKAEARSSFVNAFRNDDGSVVKDGDFLARIPEVPGRMFSGISRALERD
jgi:type IV secretory pathway VirB6-like protein